MYNTIQHILRSSLFAAVLLVVSCNECVNNAIKEDAVADIYPDYTDVMIPMNIGPLNFGMNNTDALLVDAVISDRHGNELHGQGKETTGFDTDEWQMMLSQNIGESLTVTVSAKYIDGWHTYRPFDIHVSEDSIDYGICYRLIEPGYELWSHMTISETNLLTSEQRTIVDNKDFVGCVNCHSFNRCNTSSMNLHFRGPQGATKILHDGKWNTYKADLDQSCPTLVYPYWHPDNRYIAYSTNTTRQLFHLADSNLIEVYDLESDVLLYDVVNDKFVRSPLLQRNDVLETFPSFSADGKTLYFCAARVDSVNSERAESIHYSLCSIGFDAESGTFANKVDTIVACDTCANGRLGSITLPRPSYDGRYLAYTVIDYGQFSIWHHEADIWMLDLATHETHPMARANSKETDSYHNWSSNSHWMVFSSRRDDGLFSRPYFCHINKDGSETKPFMLPQYNPVAHYRNLFMSYNLPEFIKSPVKY